jgi:hypothetical protein
MILLCLPTSDNTHLDVGVNLKMAVALYVVICIFVCIR